MHLQLLRVCILVPVVKGFWYYFPMQFKQHTLHVFIFQNLDLVQDRIKCCTSIQIDISILKGIGYKSRHIAH